MRKILVYIILANVLFWGGMVVGHIFEWNYAERESEYYVNNERLWPMLSHPDTGYIPDEGFVPDVKTAIGVAKAIWLPLFGKRALMWRRYRVKLVDESIWVIEGGPILGMNGGGPFIKIDKTRGTIIEVSHTY